MVPAAAEVQGGGDVCRRGDDLGGLEVEAARRAAQVEGALIEADLCPGRVLQQLGELPPSRREPGVLARTAPALGCPFLHDPLGQGEKYRALALDLRQVHAAGLVESHECAEGRAWPADPRLVGVEEIDEGQQEPTIATAPKVLPVLEADLDGSAALSDQ